MLVAKWCVYEIDIGQEEKVLTSKFTLPALERRGDIGILENTTEPSSRGGVLWHSHLFYPMHARGMVNTHMSLAPLMSLPSVTGKKALCGDHCSGPVLPWFAGSWASTEQLES